MNHQKAIDAAIKEYLKPSIPARIERFGRLAYWDLMYGPMTYCEECGADFLEDCKCENVYPGFEKAISEVSDWVRSLNCLYVEDDTYYVSESVPEGWRDDETGEWVEPEQWYEFERKDIIRVLFGRELVGYL